MTKKLHAPMTIYLDNDTIAKLMDLTDGGRISKSQIARQAIRHAWQMEIAHTPTCANGHSCHCPHTHTYPLSKLARGG